MLSIFNEVIQQNKLSKRILKRKVKKITHAHLHIKKRSFLSF